MRMVLSLTDDDNVNHNIVIETSKIDPSRPWVKIYMGMRTLAWEPKSMSIHDDVDIPEERQ